MNLNHDATHTILGFEYQFLYELYVLMKTEENVEEFIETYDDISVKHEEKHDLFQLKQTSKPKICNDNSDEIWRTIRN